MANRVRSWDKERAWRQRIAAWQKSGQTVRAFCREHLLSEASFHSWRRILARRDREQELQPDSSIEAGMFVPVRVTGQGSSAAVIEIVLSGGRVLRVGPGFDRQTLVDILAVVEARPC